MEARALAAEETFPRLVQPCGELNTATTRLPSLPLSFWIPWGAMCVMEQLLQRISPIPDWVQDQAASAVERAYSQLDSDAHARPMGTLARRRAHSRRNAQTWGCVHCRATRAFMQ
jgi:hypothetical protein